MELRNLSAEGIASCDESVIGSERTQVFGTAMRSAAPVVGNAIFLHTAWRSGGTWIWSRCRASARVRGFYEPLHEQAARFRRRDVAIMRPGSWQSNHSDTPPYFEEYRGLIPVRGRGVALYKERFAFDGFFKAPTDPTDFDLETYLGTLVAGPLACGRLPVLKFCRSMGRVGWLENLFPDALHLIVLRDPLAQFQSMQRLLQQQRNRYFALAPLLVLARNAQHQAVRDAAMALGVSLPALHSDDMDYTVETCWRHLRRVPAAECYRGFLAFWTLCALSALESEAAVIDIDSIGSDDAHRRSVEAALRARIGEPVRLVPRAPQQGFSGQAASPTGMAQAHLAALNFARSRQGGLSAARFALVTTKLEAGLANSRSGAPPVPGWRSPVLPRPPARRSAPRRFVTAATVMLAHAVQPLRRLHGALVRRGHPER